MNTTETDRAERNRQLLYRALESKDTRPPSEWKGNWGKVTGRYAHDGYSIQWRCDDGRTRWQHFRHGPSTMITLHLKPKSHGPFNNHPGADVELEPERICANNVILPWEFNPHKVRLWVVGNEFGALGAVWGRDGDALDELCDQGLSTGLMIDERDVDNETAHLGNAGEPHNLDHAWIHEVDLSDLHLLALFEAAREADQTTLQK